VDLAILSPDQDRRLAAKSEVRILGDGPEVRRRRQAGMRIYFKGEKRRDQASQPVLRVHRRVFALRICGEAPILIRTKDGKVHSIAGVGTMPKLATAEFFRQRKLQPGEILAPPEQGGLKGIIPVAGLMPGPAFPAWSTPACWRCGTMAQIVRRRDHTGHRTG